MPFRSIGPVENGLIVLIIRIVLGVGKMHKVGGDIGKGMRAFRKGQRGENDDAEDEEPKPKRAAGKKAAKRRSE